MKVVQVAAAVIERGDEICLARRPDHLHQGGKWEFPGGKMEAGESVLDAIRRELKEELNLDVAACEPLIQINHQYPDKAVCLNVVKVNQFVGEPQGMEGQEVRWVAMQQLQEFDFPAANVPIVAAAQLPRFYVITPEVEGSVDAFLLNLENLVQQGYGFIQIRTKRIDAQDWACLLAGLERIKARHMALTPSPVQFILNSAVNQPLSSVFDGVHLTAAALHSGQPLPEGVHWVGASCHNAQDLQKALELGVDFVTLSALNSTATHPDQPPLGSAMFASLVEQAKLPVFALGGVGVAELNDVLHLGAQGVAGIRGFWPA